MNDPSLFSDISEILGTSPGAVALLSGSEKYPDLRGLIGFYPTDRGVLTVARFVALPKSEACASRFFALHIHGGGECKGNSIDPFAAAGTHFDPHACPHPYHAGDLPPVMESMGGALSVFLTDRFTLDEIIGKSVILHDRPDDFTTQPAGNAGEKIACVVIQRLPAEN